MSLLHTTTFRFINDTLIKSPGTLTTSSISGTTNVGNLLSSATTTTSTSYPTASPIAPSEVLPNTAISDRPKVKSVSKKDSKNNRKVVAAANAALQANLQQQEQQKQPPEQQHGRLRKSGRPESPSSGSISQNVSECCVEQPSATGKFDFCEQIFRCLLGTNLKIALFHRFDNCRKSRDSHIANRYCAESLTPQWIGAIIRSKQSSKRD